MDIKVLKDKFREVFESEVGAGYFSPGRVNLIGEHTDYNGGHVFPCALTIGTYGLVKKRDDKKVRFYSLNFEELGTIEVDLENLVYDKKDDWTNYAKGVIKTFENHGYKMTNGLDILVYGNIPNGSGLSSSASLEVLVGTIINDIFNFNVDMVDTVKMSQEAENKFVGVNCGIMDQFAIGMGKKDSAILLDCNTLKYKYSKLDLEGYKIVIGNTNKKRGLADSKYNERRSECEAALKEIQTIKDVSALGELTEGEFEEVKSVITNETNVRRAKHAVYENQRTLRAIEALNNNDLELFGKLLNASHVSLRDDYEVTGKELDTLVSIAWECEGVLGARMTGAGFGGCTVSIVKDENVEAFINTITTKYTEAIGYSPTFYIVTTANGTGKIEI